MINYLGYGLRVCQRAFERFRNSYCLLFCEDLLFLLFFVLLLLVAFFTGSVLFAGAERRAEGLIIIIFPKSLTAFSAFLSVPPAKRSTISAPFFV